VRATLIARLASEFVLDPPGPGAERAR
jgi:hypothetical protein